MNLPNVSATSVAACFWHVGLMPIIIGNAFVKHTFFFAKAVGFNPPCVSMRLLIGLLLLINVQAKAQTTFSCGIKGGVTMGALIGKIDPETSSGAPTWRPHAGLFGEIALNEKWAFRPELMYNRSGVTYAENLPRTDTLFPFYAAIDTFFVPTFYTSDIQGEYDMHYVELPLKMVFYVNPKMGLTFGPRLSWLVKGSNIGTRQIDVGENAGQQENYDSEADYLDALFTRSFTEYDDGNTIEKFDFGWMIGSQYRFTNYLSAYFDSSIGLTQAQKPSENVPYAFRNLYLCIGLSLDIAGRAEDDRK